MQDYCREVVLVPNPHGREGLWKRLLQLRSLASTLSFDRLRVMVPALQPALDKVLSAKRFDIVNLEFPYLGYCDLRRAPAGEKPPSVVVDSHEIAYDLARQFARAGGSFYRRLYAAANWRKLRREELETYGSADGVYLCSALDETRLLKDIPAAHTAVVPNAADVEYFQPRPADPPPDGRTVVFFGILSTVPNVDGVTHFIEDIWPRIAAAHPDARFKIIGGPAAAVAAGAGRSPDRVDRLRAGPAAAPCGGSRAGGAAAAGRRDPAEDRRGHGHGEGHRVDVAGGRGDRGGPRARPSHRR
jgi:hypothetical protein